MKFQPFITGLLWALPWLVPAAPAAAADAVTVRGAWARATVPGQAVGAAYMELRSAAGAVVTAASSPAAQKTELHTMGIDQGVMRMRPVERIAVPAGGSVKLAPGGLHVMLVGLKQPLQAGQKVPLTLTVQDAAGQSSQVEVSAEVRRLEPAAAAHTGH